MLHFGFGTKNGVLRAVGNVCGESSGFFSTIKVFQIVEWIKVLCDKYCFPSLSDCWKGYLITCSFQLRMHKFISGPHEEGVITDKSGWGL